MGLSTGQFRAALGHWPSGVSVVTTQVESVPAGMTVSAFFSVSLSPPLVAVCLDRRALTLGLIQQSGHFAVNVLSQAQHALSDRFAAPDNEPVRFEGVALHAAEGAHSPLIVGAVVHLDCELQAMHAAGDHVLCVGEVGLALTHPGAPLVYHASGYHSLLPLGAQRP
jgi:3-hydroxy-9,10-secoandrosta-1,3,5(10)-triene-9,17-dione monooxygenase reductase component